MNKVTSHSRTRSGSRGFIRQRHRPLTKPVYPLPLPKPLTQRIPTPVNPVNPFSPFSPIYPIREKIYKSKTQNPVKTNENSLISAFASEDRIGRSHRKIASEDCFDDETMLTRWLRKAP